MRLLKAFGCAFLTVTAQAALADELFTTAGAILCVQRDNVSVANDKQVLLHPSVLKGMGCCRSPRGLRIKVIERTDSGEPWMVRFFPEGISRGVLLWGWPNAFAPADGSKPAA